MKTLKNVGLVVLGIFVLGCCGLFGLIFLFGDFETEPSAEGTALPTRETEDSGRENESDTTNTPKPLQTATLAATKTAVPTKPPTATAAPTNTTRPTVPPATNTRPPLSTNTAPPLPTNTTAPLPTWTLTLPPTQAPQPTQELPTDTPLPPVAACDCYSGDTLNCSDFNTHNEAQACYDACVALGLGDVHGLDGNNNNGLACESLP